MGAGWFGPFDERIYHATDKAVAGDLEKAIESLVCLVLRNTIK